MVKMYYFTIQRGTMENLKLQAVIAGVFFGIWPLLMNRSGLNGNFSSFVFTAVILVCIAPFAIGHAGNLSQANWFMVVGAGVCSYFWTHFLQRDALKNHPSECESSVCTHDCHPGFLARYI